MNVMEVFPLAHDSKFNFTDLYEDKLQWLFSIFI